MSVKVLVVGCGNMGKSHAKAYHSMDGFEIVGLVSRGEKSRQDLIEILGHDYPQFSDYSEALAKTNPDAVSINTYPDTHAEYTKMALESLSKQFVLLVSNIVCYRCQKFCLFVENFMVIRFPKQKPR